MKITFVSENFGEEMGYATNLLPKALASLGADVSVITTPQRIYYQDKATAEVYDSFPRPVRRPGDIVSNDGYDIHYLDFGTILGKTYIKGLARKLAALRPEVVQTFSHVTFAPIQIALHKQGSDHLLFTGNHMTASVFPLAQSKSKWWHRASLINLFMRKLPGVYVSRHIVKCFGATSDCSRVATEFLGVPREKIVTIPLGVDTDIFHPSESDKDKESERVDLGYSPDDIVCIYTGRFTKDKNPLLLAQAVDALADVDNRFKGLFFGAGEQREAIGKCRNVKIMGFVPFHNLAKYYRLADIGVWPTQESTSMIDAAACGLPIVVNDTLRATERIEGNGVTYRLNDKEDLVRALASLADSSLRRRLGQAGATKMLDKFSWQSIARVRLEEYKAALQAQHKPD